MDDLISRQAAIDAVGKYLKKDGDVITIADVVDAAVAIGILPSAEPERKKGFWIIENEFLGDCIDRCSVCGWKYNYYGFDDERDYYNFCPNCGADMRGGENATD